MRIGVDQAPGRPEYHNSHNCSTPLPGVEYTAIPALPLGRIAPGAARTILQATHLPARHRRVDLLHLWNRVSMGRRPWGVTFESHFPRTPTLAVNHGGTRVLRDRLNQDRCRFLIATSKWARDRFVATLSDDQRVALGHKLHVVYPSQRVQETSPPAARLEPDEELRIAFVGHDFFRKGGEALLRLLERHGDALHLHLEVISEVRAGDYATRHISEDYASDIRRRLASLPRVRWRQSATNAEVLATFAAAHVGALPTLADTFGYSLMEAMVQGRAAIGTNVSAGPEIVGGGGWVVEIPTYVSDRWAGEWTGSHDSASDYGEAIETLVDGIGRVLTSVRDRPQELHVRASEAAATTRDRFGRDRDNQLLDIYSRVVT